MKKGLKDYKWTYLEKVKEVLSYDEFICFPINSVRTMKIIELTQICEVINSLKKDSDLTELYVELSDYLRKNKKLILNAETICPGVNTDTLNMMTVKLLSQELTDDEKMKLLVNQKAIKNSFKKLNLVKR